MEADKPGLGLLLCLFAGLGWLVLFRALVSSLHPHLKEAPSGKNEAHERFPCGQMAPAATPASPVLTETKNPGLLAGVLPAFLATARRKAVLPMECGQVQAFPT